jgi:hypothetical protein
LFQFVCCERATKLHRQKNKKECSMAFEATKPASDAEKEFAIPVHDDSASSTLSEEDGEARRAGALSKEMGEVVTEDVDVEAVCWNSP